MTLPPGALAEEPRRSRWAWLWSEPNVVLLDASTAGERLSGRIRIVVALLIAIVAGLDLASGSDQEGLGWAVFAFVGLGLAIFIYVVVSRGFYRPWLGLVTSTLDVSVVSLGLDAFLAIDQPHLAVNSKVVYEAYFLALAATCLRYDPRICLWAGALAVLQYGGIVAYAAANYELGVNNQGTLGFTPFSWHAQVARLSILAGFTFLATIIVKRARELHRLSSSDFLTGLHNRGYFDQRFREEVIRARRHKHPLSVAMVDVDRFKNFNDTYGHSAGDLALQAIAKMIKENLRLTDVVARYGGEELVVVMPETAADAAVRKMEQIREIVAEMTLELPRRTLRGVLTFSTGIAAYPEDGDEVDPLVAKADARLFAAKQAGRNRVVGPHDHSGLRSSQEMRAMDLDTATGFGNQVG
jgi:two-component system cell cycle response regulator